MLLRLLGVQWRTIFSAVSAASAASSAASSASITATYIVTVVVVTGLIDVSREKIMPRSSVTHFAARQYCVLGVLLLKDRVGRYERRKMPRVVVFEAELIMS